MASSIIFVLGGGLNFLGFHSKLTAFFIMSAIVLAQFFNSVTLLGDLAALTKKKTGGLLLPYAMPTLRKA